MATWQHTFSMVMGDYPPKTADLFPLLDQFLPRAWGTNELQYWGDTQSNDVHISFNATTQQIEDIQFRIDLRTLDRNFIQWVIDLAKARGWKFHTEKTGAFEPELSTVDAILTKSNASKFVHDPQQFLRDLEDGTITIESDRI